MDCPVCKDQKLVMSDRQGIEIDYCPNCRGVWLDRGELDKIIDKSTDAEPQQVQQPARNEPPYQGQPSNAQGPGYSQPSQGYPHPQHGYHKKKRKGFLGELFDF